MDFDCYRNTIITNCRLNSPLDDRICPKSSYALGRDVVTENMTKQKWGRIGPRDLSRLSFIPVGERGDGSAALMNE